MREGRRERWRGEMRETRKGRLPVVLSPSRAPVLAVQGGRMICNVKRASPFRQAPGHIDLDDRSVVQQWHTRKAPPFRHDPRLAAPGFKC
eukprot:1063164-Pyramimonas_sp.AAC.1